MTIATFLSLITAPAPISGGEFGRWVSLSRDGNWLAVSNKTITGYSAFYGGAIVYTNNGDSWTYHSTIPPNVAGQTTGTFFCYTGVCFNKDGTLIVTSDAGYDSNTGRIIVLARSGTSWVLQSIIDSPGLGTNKYFGQWLSINDDGDVLVTASSKLYGIHTFTRSGTVWSQLGTVYTLPTAGWSSGEYALSLNAAGTRLLVGDCWYDNSGTGRALVLAATGNPWALEYSFSAPTPVGYQIFGRAVALSGNGAIGVVYEETYNLGKTGTVYLYNLASATPELLEIVVQPALIIQNDLNFGWALSLSSDGKRLVTGSLYDTPSNNCGGVLTHSLALSYEPFWTEYDNSYELEQDYS
jgi:hypothetical protein